MGNKIKKWILKKICKGMIPITPTQALWELIDTENQKEEPRCDYIEAWLEAIENVRNYKQESNR